MDKWFSSWPPPSPNLVSTPVRQRSQVWTYVRNENTENLEKAVTKDNLELLNHVLTADPKTLLSRIFPDHNTALHMAARLGFQHIADRILQECETLMLEKNIDGDTPLHVASKFDKIEVADLLINYSEKWPFDIESDEGDPLTITNELGNTALHVAVTYGKSDEVAMRLLEADPSLGHMPNQWKESPLFIAAMEGKDKVVTHILKQPWVETKGENQANANLLLFHKAVLRGHITIVNTLLSERSDFAKQLDRDGNNALHYAAQNNNWEMVELLLTKEPSNSYVRNKNSLSPLHVAVQYGSISAVELILKCCPGTAEQLGPNGGNAFHVAVTRGMLCSLKCLMKNIPPEGQINGRAHHRNMPLPLNHKDFDGNTPLHLAAKKSSREICMLLASDKRVNVCLKNNMGETARGVIELLDVHETGDNNFLVWRDLRKLEAKRCKMEYVPQPRDGRMQSRAEKYFQLSFQTYTIIAALIATVTFAATFTMPGGYDQQTGYAILRKETAFNLFVACNTFGMCSALVVVVCFIWAREDMVKFDLNQRKLLHTLTILALVSLLASLITAVYIVVETKWLISVVILIGLCTPVMVVIVLKVSSLTRMATRLKGLLKVSTSLTHLWSLIRMAYHSRKAERGPPGRRAEQYLAGQQAELGNEPEVVPLEQPRGVTVV